MWLIPTIFTASLLGSLHCAGMCGAFLAIAVGDGSKPSRAPQIAYHLGRLTTYVILGAIAGTLGHLIDMAGTLAGLQPIALIIAGSVTIVFGVTSLLTTLGYRSVHWHPPAFMAKLARKAHGMAMKHGPVARGGLIGLFTTLLPCGWLYAFVAVAAGQASPLRGMLAMAIFWTGTLPVMVSLGLGIRGLLGGVGRRVPVVTCIALILVGAMTLIGRNHISALALAATTDKIAQSHSDPTTQPACCGDPHAQ